MSTTAGEAPAPRTRPAGRWSRRWLPPQHGAWAMLLLPYLVGVVRVGPAWIHLPLLVAWLAGYLFSYYAQLAVKTGTTARVRGQLAGYGIVTAVAGVLVLALRPQLALAVPAFAPLLAVNVWYARRRRDRALVNGLASALQGTFMVAVAVAAAGGRVSTVAVDAVALFLAFTGSLLYVKTMIRERGEPAWLRASVGFHLVALAVTTVLEPVLAVPFGWFLLRAVLLPRRSPTVQQVGLLELAGSLLLGAVLVLVR